MAQIDKQTENVSPQLKGNLPPANRQHPRLLGIWDLHTAPLTLGGLLTIVEELHALSIIRRTEVAGICLISDASHSLSVTGVPVSGSAFVQLDSATCASSVFLSMLLNLKGVNIIYHAGSLAAVKDFISRNSREYITWPSIDALDETAHIDHPYGTTFFLQRFYDQHRTIPVISAKPGPLRWALRWTKRYVLPSLPVVVHLKNNPHEQWCSNAKFDQWLSFFNDCTIQYNVKFIVVGNEKVPDSMRKMPNVLVSQDIGSTLARDLALIQTAFIFMGMASGPCNMAVFSDIPYVIYKNPEHHAEEMHLELGEGNQFSFATPSQKLLRVLETRENLMKEFVYLYTHISRQDWETRLANLQ